MTEFKLKGPIFPIKTVAKIPGNSNRYLPTETVRELLTHVPGNAKSELPSGAHHAMAPELAGESELGPLHMAAYSGSEDVVRVLLNSSGVQVEGASKPSVSRYYQTPSF